MKTFETDDLKFTVQPGPVDGTWEVVIEAPRTKIKPLVMMTGGEGPEASVAIDLLNQMAHVHKLGVAAYLKKAEREFSDVDPAQLKQMSAMLFKITDAVGGHDALTALAERVQRADFEPEEWEGFQAFQKGMVANWTFGDLNIDVRPMKMMTPEIVGYHVKFQKPGTPLYEDLMQRPMGYLLAQIGKEQIMIMRRTLQMGIEGSARHFLKANYLGAEYLPQMTTHATNIDRIARAIGEAELERLEGLLEAETDKEHDARQGAKGKLEKAVERLKLERLESRERQLVQQIEALKKRLGNRGA